MALPKKITEEQQELLIDYLETHRRMITGKLDNSFTYKDHAKLWEDVTKKLNSCAGAKKTATNWRKSWQDMKRNVKEKYGRIRGHRRRTGGGKATTEKLTPQQERILALMGPTVVTGHPLIEESAVEEVNASVEEQQDNTTGASLVNLIAAPHNLPVLADSNVLNPDDGILPSSPAGPSNVNNIGFSQTSILPSSPAGPSNVNNIGFSQTSILPSSPAGPSNVNNIGFSQTSIFPSSPAGPSNVNNIGFSQTSILPSSPAGPSNVNNIGFSQTSILPSSPAGPSNVNNIGFSQTSILPSSPAGPSNVNNIEFSQTSILPSSPAGPSNVNNIGFSQTSSLEDSFATEPSRSFVTAAKPAAPSKKRKGSSAYTPATKAAEVLSSFKERELELRQREVEVQELFVREGLAILREGLAFVRESEERKATAMENIAAALASIASAQQQQ